MRMWAPSTSASVAITILWYRAPSMSNSSWTPVPIAVIRAWISLLARTLSMRLFSTLMILPRSGSTACVLRSRACLAEPPAESPSTTKISARARILDRAVGELAGQGRVLQRRLAGQVAGFAGGRTGAGGVDRLHDHPPGVGRVLLQVLAQLAVDGLLDQAADRRVAEFGLGLALELRVVQLDRDHRGQPLAHVLAGEVVVFLLFQQAFVAGVGVERPGQRRAEAGEVGAALVGVDVVGEAEDRLLVGAVPLHRDLDLALLFAALEEDDLLVDRILVAVEVADEVLDPALVLEGDAVGLPALVDQLDLQATGEEGRLAQALDQRLEIEPDLFEDLEVGEEGDRGPVLGGRVALLQLGHRLAALVVLLPDVAVALDLQVQALGEGVDDGDADAVQAARDLVAAAVPELAAGVEDRQHDLGRGAPLFRHRLDRDAAPVVGDRAAVVRMEDDADAVAVAGEGLVD